MNKLSRTETEKPIPAPSGNIRAKNLANINGYFSELVRSEGSRIWCDLKGLFERTIR